MAMYGQGSCEHPVRRGKGWEHPWGSTAVLPHWHGTEGRVGKTLFQAADLTEGSIAVKVFRSL